MLLQMVKFLSFFFYGWVVLHCVCTHIFFIHLSANEHLGCFHILRIVNHAAMNIRVHVSLQITVFISHIYRFSGVESLGHVVILLFVWLHQILVASSGIFSWGVWDIVPWPVTEPRPPALGARSLNHCTTSKVPAFSLEFWGNLRFVSHRGCTHWHSH